MSLEIAELFYRLFVVDEANQPKRFIGSAFPITPSGGLLTCRHVVSVAMSVGDALAVFDPAGGGFVRLRHPPLFPSDPAVDVAYLRDAFGRPKSRFFPILSPSVLKVGEDVYTFGFFCVGGGMSEVEQGYFAGKIVSFFRHEQTIDQASLILPFPILEGMSGSPVLTYHNGPKVVGMAIGNRASRILASEIFEYQDGKTTFKETVNRIVEFGIAYHCGALIRFLGQAGVSDFVVSDSRVSLPGLE